MYSWQNLLDKACKETSCAQVARELGVSRTVISLLKNGKYGSETAHMAKRIEEKLGRVHCPGGCCTVSVAECEQNVAKPMPTSSPYALEAWKRCKECYNNRKNKE